MTENMRKLLEIVSASKELSDDELDAEVGGGKCICSFGGGGKAGEDEKTCVCVMGGGGEYSDGSVRCVCIIGGDGNR